MVLTFHQLQRLMGVLVVEAHCLAVVDIHGVGKALVELDEAHDAIVDQGDELRTDAFAHQRLLLDLQRTDALCLDKQLIGKSRRAQDAPRGFVVVKLLLKQRTAFRQCLFKLSVCLFHLAIVLSV